MAIASVEVVPYALPFKEPYVTARGTLERREMVLLRLRDEDGVEGLGEAVPLTLRGGATLGQVVDELAAWGERARETRNPWGPAQMSRPALCAVRTAQLDLAARGAGGPLFWLFQTPGDPQPIRCNATLTAAEPVHVAQQALAWAADGFQAFKLKVGTAADTETVGLVRDAVGSEAELRLDANGAWSVDEACGILAELASHGIKLVEQPVATLEEMAALRERSEIPIAADESVETVGDAQRAYAIEACDYLSIKLSKVGKVDLEDFEVFPLYVTSALDGPVGIAAAAHAVQALRARNSDVGLAHGLATQRLFSATIAAVECELRGDMLHLPEGPGLGVEIDEAALAHHRL